MSLRIVHLTTFLQGGAGRAITDLACAQHAAGHDVLVMTSATGEPGYDNYSEYLDRLRATGVPTVAQDSLFKRDADLNRRALDRLLGLCSPEDIDVVHAHAAVPAAIGLAYVGAAFRRPAIIQTQHGWGTNKTPEQARHDLDVLHRVDRVVVTSAATGRLLGDAGVPEAHIEVIPCGIEATAPSMSDAARTFTVRERFVLGCIGSVTANKNQQMLVRALADLTRTMKVRAASDPPSVHAVFIGEGGDSLIPLAQQLGVADRVHIAGYQPAADRWFPLFDALVVPSRSEGQGLVVLEAFRARVPVVASNIAALREMVVERETGWLFDLDDDGGLAETIAQVASTPRQELQPIVDAAERCFRERYAIEATIARHDALYARLTRRALS